MSKEITAEEKLRQYEELLDEITQSEFKKEGVILAGPDKDLYKIKTGDGEIIASSPLFKCKKGDHVIIVKGTVTAKLPEALITVEEAEIEFDRIEWNSIGGMKSQLESIQRKVEFPSKYKKLYQEFNLSPSKGILLYGPPGCGKTLIAKAIASSMLNKNKINKQLFV